MAVSTLEILIQARDQASDALERVGDAGSKAAGLIEKHWLKATAVLAGAGAGIEALARKQQDQRVAVDQLAIRMGKSSDEVNTLARSLANVGFPLEDVTGLLEQATRRGLESEAQLKDYANFWDTVADATGGSAVELGKAGGALQSMGIAIGEESKAMDAFGFITKNTTVGVDEFLSFVGRAAPDLNTLGISVNDAAAVMAIMEKRGIQGRAAISEFSAAASSSKGNLNDFLETLKITEEQFADTSEDVVGAGQVMNDLAGAVDANFTPLQKLQHELTEVGARFQAPIKAAADFAPILIAIGPAAKGVQVAMGALPAVIKGVNAAMLLLAANPIVLIIVGIVAAVAALSVGIWLLWKNWDTVWGFITDSFRRVVDNIVGLYESGFGWILPFGPLVKAITFLGDHWRDIWEGMQAVFDTVVGGLRGGIHAFIDPLIGGLNALIDAINSIPDVDIPSWVPFVGGNKFGIPNVANVPIPSFGDGGIVPGPAGAPLMAVVHGGERITPPGAGVTIGTLVINASSRDAGRQAADGFFEELRRLELSGRIARVTT